MKPPSSADAPAVMASSCSAEHLGFRYPGGEALLVDLSFTLRPGLTLVRGGDGRGKTTLLRLIAAALQPTAGVLQRHVGTLSYETPVDGAHDAVVARAWLGQRRQAFEDWRDDVAQGLIDGLGLAEHLDKPLFMLSTGSRRKVGLVASAASQAGLTLLETPFAALDARSSRCLAALLAQAADDRRRTWVLADYALPPGLAEGRLAGLIDLGDG